MAQTAPPGRHPRILQSSKGLVAEASFCPSGWGVTFPGFHQFPSRRFHLKVPDVLQTLRHYFHFALGRCRPTACPVCTPPLSLAVEQNPLLPILASGSHYSASLLSLSPECCRLFPSAFLESYLQAFTSRFSGPRGPSDNILRLVTGCMLRSAYYPCWFSSAELPDRHPSCVRNSQLTRRVRATFADESTSLCACLSACAA